MAYGASRLLRGTERKICGSTELRHCVGAQTFAAIKLPQQVRLVGLQNRHGEDSFELHSVDLELETVEKQIRDLQVKQAQLRQRKAALQSPSARTRPAQVSFTPAPGYHAAWMQQQRKTRAKPRARTSPPPPPPVFEIPTQNRFAPLRETECDTVIIGDSIVRHVPAILKKNIGAVVLHAGTNDIRLRQTEILKKDFRSLVELGTPEAAEAYRQAKRAAAWVVSEAKTRVWEVLIEAMEKDYQMASGKFWQTVRRLRRCKQISANTVYSGAGELLALIGDIVRRWKEYFKDLLNPTDMSSVEEPEAEDSEVDSFITQSEVTEVVQQLLCSKGEI
ncbi:hypothetical protein QTP70_008337 [Hemibagrus guttatus]|uniref:Uncharacterized protein n=1 Tax=Hemibagrus guttatus TaxID=175788 RepID=A0AAE0VC79_9TELE|nr:hypothetical protein QTP70_008337 [Hemibagrus guttatus]KAK3574076.1 hypothetical protein QTP86_002872 [Hemibagrus guttatus]